MFNSKNVIIQRLKIVSTGSPFWIPDITKFTAPFKWITFPNFLRL